MASIILCILVLNGVLYCATMLYIINKDDRVHKDFNLFIKIMNKK